MGTLERDVLRTSWGPIFDGWDGFPVAHVLYGVAHSGCGSCGSSLVSLEVFSPAQILLIVQKSAIRHSFFFLPFFLFFFTVEFKNCFFSQFLLFFSVFFSALSFLFKSAVLSFLSASPLCSITIQSALFLLFVIF